MPGMSRCGAVPRESGACPEAKGGGALRASGTPAGGGGTAAPAEFRHIRNVRPTPWVYEAASASPHPRLRINAPFVSTDLHDSLRPFG